jgi:small-conductance mechanosensitive channel
MSASGLQWALAAGVLAAFVTAGFLVRLFLSTWVRRWAEKTKTHADDVVLGAIRVHVVLWSFLLGVQSAATVLTLPPQALRGMHKVLVILWGLSLTLWAAQVLGNLARHFISRTQGGTREAASLSIYIVRAVTVGLGGLLILSNIGVSITPLLTALGVGSLAVALALQDTLSNLFAGFYILLNRQIRPGDYIRLDSGQEGTVRDIGWRSTAVHELANNVVLIPNAKLAQAIVTNFTLPDPELACLVNVGVSYDSDLAEVEKLTVGVAREIQKTVPGAAENFEPFIRYNAFGDSSVNFTVIMRAKQFVDRFLMTHEFMKRLHTVYARENIEIPFPQRVVHLRTPVFPAVAAPGPRPESPR